MLSGLLKCIIIITVDISVFCYHWILLDITGLPGARSEISGPNFSKFQDNFKISGISGISGQLGALILD